MTQQNRINAGFKDSGYLEPQNSSGKTFGNLSYIESKRNLSNAERSVKLGNVEEAKTYLNEFTALSGLHHADLQKGWLGSSKEKENLMLIRNLSDNYNISTISRYRDEALRRGQNLNAGQFLKLYEKSQQASVNMESALEVSEFLDSTLSKMKRSDSIEGITDIALSKLDEIRIKHLYSGKSMEDIIAKRIEDIDKNSWSFYTAQKTKDFTGGVISNVTGMLDLAGDLYTVITGSENPIQATDQLAKLMKINTSSKTFKAGMFSGFAAFTPLTAAGMAYKAASGAGKLEAATRVLASYANKTAAGIHAIHTGTALGAMSGAQALAGRVVEATNLNENRKKALPNLIGFGAGIGTSYLLSKYYGNTPKNANKGSGDGITKGSDTALPEGDSPSSIVAEKNNKILEDIMKDSTGETELTPSERAIERPMRINNELNADAAANNVASQIPQSEESTIRFIEKAKKANTTKGENFEGAYVVDDNIYNLTTENIAQGSRNSANYNRTIESNGKLSEISTNIETDATVLHNKAVELAATEPSERALEIQRDLLIDKGEVSGLEESMSEVVNYINEVIPTETLSRLTEQGSVLISDVLRSESNRVVDANPDLAASLIKLGNVIENTLAYKSKIISTEGLLAKDILAKADAARTNVLLDTAEISTTTIDTQRLKDVAYLNEVTSDGIAELKANINESFNIKYEGIDNAVDFYLRENPNKAKSIRTTATALIELLKKSTEKGADGTTDYYFKPIIDKIAASTNEPKQIVVENLVSKIENSPNLGRALREVLRSIDTGVLENKTIRQSALRRGGSSATFTEQILEPLSEIVDNLYSDSLNGDMNIYKGLKREYAAFASDRAALQADAYRTKDATQFNAMRKNPKLFNNLKSHLKGRIIDPNSSIAVLEQVLKAKSIEGMIDVGVNGDISTAKDSNIVKALNENKAKIRELYSESTYNKLVEIAEHLEGSKERISLLERLNSEGATQDSIIEEMNSGSSNYSVQENLNVVRKFMKGIKNMFIPIKSIFTVFMGVKFLTAGIEAAAYKLAHSKAKNIANSALALEAAPAFKAIIAKSFADNIVKNGGYYTRNTKG